MEAILVTTPQETIKVKLIDDAFKSKTPRFKGFFHGVQTIVSETGITGCYKGLAPTIFKVATAQATRFGLYNYIPAKMREGPIKSAIAGAAAGLTSVVLFHPIDVIKSRMQGLDAARYTGVVNCAQVTWQEGGMAAIYKGVIPRGTRVMCEVGITMSLYGEIVKVLNYFWHTD